MSNTSSLFPIAILLTLTGVLPASGQDEGRNGWANPFPSLDGYVADIVDDGGTVYVAGFFSRAGDVPANNIAKWDGRKWSPLGEGLDGQVFALAVADDGALYAGGVFSQAGGRPARFIARWDGNQWTSVGGGMNQFVQSLAVDDEGMLFAGGAFTQAGSVEANYIARWDGLQWQPLGTGMDHNVFSIAPAGSGRLYAGGGFMWAGGKHAANVAMWDGSRWHAVGMGMNDVYGRPVWSLVVDEEGILYAGGKFLSADGKPAAHVARWDGSRWSAMGAGLNGIVRTLAVGRDGSIYAGGYFTGSGQVPIQHVARWNGIQWARLGGGTNGIVDALAVGEHMVHVGGLFSLAQDLSAGSVACWHSEVTPTKTRLDQEAPRPSLVFQPGYPNPFVDVTTLSYDLPQPAHVSLRIFDALGKELLILIEDYQGSGRHEVTFDASGFPVGVYFAFLKTGSATLARKLVVTR